MFLSSSRSVKIPNFLVPPEVRNHGYYTASLQKLIGWLAGEAEKRGVNLLPSTTGVEVLYDGERVVGVLRAQVRGDELGRVVRREHERDPRITAQRRDGATHRREEVGIIGVERLAREDDRERRHAGQIELAIDLDGKGTREIQTPLPFLDHMLEAVARR